MNTKNILLTYYEDMLYIFGVCPCCGEIFNLSHAIIRLKKTEAKLPRFQNIFKLQETVTDKEAKLEEAEEENTAGFEELSDENDDYDFMEPEIIQKFRYEGQKQAFQRIKKVDHVFTNRKLDPRDARLICTPVEFILFNGMTEDNEIDSIDFVTKHPSSKQDEKRINSIEQAIKSGNVDFVIVSVSEDGYIRYSSSNKELIEDKI